MAIDREVERAQSLKLQVSDYLDRLSYLEQVSAEESEKASLLKDYVMSSGLAADDFLGAVNEYREKMTMTN